MALNLRNPHSVLAAFDARPEAVREVRIAGVNATGAWKDVVQLAREHQVPVSGAVSAAHGRRGEKSGRSGITEAVVEEKRDVDFDELFAGASSSGGALWLALDQIQDPHNAGAIFRAAAFFGVRGAVLTRNRSAPLSQTVYDVASGGVEYVPFSRPANLSRAIVSAKKAGLWILGTSQHADEDVSTIDVARPWMVVLGNEERGLRRLTAERCDQLCRITPRGRVDSLNVATAAAVLLSHLSSRGV